MLKWCCRRRIFYCVPNKRNLCCCTGHIKQTDYTGHTGGPSCTHVDIYLFYLFLTYSYDALIKFWITYFIIIYILKKYMLYYHYYHIIIALFDSQLIFTSVWAPIVAMKSFERLILPKLLGGCLTQYFYIAS